MKTAAVALILLCAVIALSVFGSIYVEGKASDLYEFAKGLPDSADGLSESDRDALEADCEKMLGKWESCRPMMCFFLSSANVYGIYAQLQSLCTIFQFDDAGADYSVVVATLRSTAKLMYDGEKLNFSNIFG